MKKYVYSWFFPQQAPQYEHYGKPEGNMRGIPRNRYDGGGDSSKNVSAPGAPALVETVQGAEMVSNNGYVSPSDQPTPKLTHKKKIGTGAGAGGSDDVDVAANAISKNAATTTSAQKEGGLLYHKSMLAYPLITTTSRVKSTSSGGSSSVDKGEDEATMVSNLTDPTALKRSDVNLDCDAANFVGASAAEQKEAANQVEKVESGVVVAGHVAMKTKIMAVMKLKITVRSTLIDQ